MRKDSKDHIETLLQVSTFKDFNKDDLSDLAQYIDEIQYTAGNTLLEHHKKVENVSILKKGQVEVLVNNEIVALVDATNCFGEMSCLSGEENAAATVRTTTDCTILQLSRDDFLKSLYRRPQLFHSFFSLISSRIVKTNQRLSEVLNHTPQGLMKIDSKGMISNEYSKVCCNFFNKDKLSGINFAELAFFENEKVQQNWQEVLNHLFSGDDMMASAALFDLLPQEITFQHSDGDRIYKLSYYPCLEQGKVVAIDIGVEDITSTREFELKEQELEKEKEILKKIYDGPDSYMNLISLYEANITALESFPNDFEKENIIVLRLLHNLKGMSGFFNLDYISQQVHLIETICQNIKTDRNKDDQLNNQFQLEFAKFKVNLNKVKGYFNDIDPELKKRLLGIVIEQKQYTKLKQAVGDREYEQIEKMIKELEMVPVTKLVQNWPSEIERLGIKLNKFVTLKIIDESIMLPVEVFNELDPPFIHFLRNCMDHGLETLEERQEMGKEYDPIIIFRTYHQDSSIWIEIEDNGRGINYSILKKKALENKHLDRDMVNKIITDNELWRLLFIPGFSSAEKVTDVSGRGVGLESIASSLQSLGGAIHVSSEIGKGTIFKLKIPIS